MCTRKRDRHTQNTILMMLYIHNLIIVSEIFCFSDNFNKISFPEIFHMFLFFSMRRGGLRISSSSVWERKQMTKWTSPMRKCGRDVNTAQSPYLSSLLKSVSFRYQNSCLSVRSLSCACVYEIKNSVRIIDNVPPVVSFCCSQLCCRSASFAVNASLSTSFL